MAVKILAAVFIVFFLHEKSEQAKLCEIFVFDLSEGKSIFFQIRNVDAI